MRKELEPETKLWFACVGTNLSDAIGPFSIPNEHLNIPSIKTQYDKIRKDFSIKQIRIPKRTRLHKKPLQTKKARAWFESSNFDDLLYMLGDHDFSLRENILNLIQEAISLEKKLFDEFCENNELF